MIQVDEMVPVSEEVTDEVIAAYKESRLIVSRRIAIFESDGETPWARDVQPRLMGGDVSVDFSRDERRTISLTLDNSDGELNHDTAGFWYDKIIKTYRGLVYRDAQGVKKKFECQTGEFMIDTISSDRFPSALSVSGRDYAKKLLLNQFAEDTAFPAGMSLDQIVKVVATNGGIKKFRLSVESVQIASNVVFAREASRWESIKTLCESLNVELYFDRQGYLVTRMYDDVATTPPRFRLTDDEGEQNIVDFSRSSTDTNIFNHVVVTGTSEEETVTGFKFISIAENTDPSSPTSIQRLGRRTFSYSVDYITSQQQADDLASRLLQVKQLEDFNLSFSTVCIPWIEAGRILEFKEPGIGDSVPVRFLFDTFSIPMGNSGRCLELERESPLSEARISFRPKFR